MKDKKWLKQATHHIKTSNLDVISCLVTQPSAGGKIQVPIIQFVTYDHIQSAGAMS